MLAVAIESLLLTAYFSYIGDIDDPALHLSDPAVAPRYSNLPKRLVPKASYENIGVATLYLLQLIETSVHAGKQLDWGAWGLRMTGAELQAFFGPDHRAAAEIAALAAKHYVLVAGEYA